MNKLAIHGIFIFLFAALYSILEIEIEGKNGWAKNLPTTKSGLFNLTIYHLIMNVIICLVVGYSTWIISKDFTIVLFYIIAWFLIEDFLWFVLNPYFTIKKYNEKSIDWHKNWLMGIPLHNWI